MNILQAMNIKQILSENISKRRKKLGLTQAALAERLHLSKDAMIRIENGKISPKISRLPSIARNLQCTVADLMRPYTEQKPEKAEIIIDSLVGLSDEAQDIIVKLVVESSRVLHGSCDKS